METLQRPRAEWAPQSLCSSLSPEKVNELFFSDKRGRPSKDAPYLRICKACPVAYECLNWAIVHKQEGVWGGFTKSERDRLPKDFVANLVQMAKIQGWYENLPDVDEMIRKIRGRKPSNPKTLEEIETEEWDQMESPLDFAPSQIPAVVQWSDFVVPASVFG